MNQSTLVSQVLAMTHDIERAARLADWAGVERLVAARKPYLMSIEADQSPESLLMIREIQAIDAAVIAESTQARDELQREYRGAIERVNAARQYSQNAAALRY
ncbi:flagellar protein FliT [Burkholderia perseverans]|uniref:flagellar protein FliT n=1 Tax=Burkholderia perseverans TaxID=2615214 RepID=UPI001FEF94A8|nr:flagellar protein FliT [Burkholderia perseverans]